MKTVKLKDIAEAMDIQMDDIRQYYSKRDAELVMLFVDNDEFEENVALQNAIEDGDENYIRLPSEFEIHEYKIMEDFASVQPDEIKEKLLDKLHSKGAFRKFKDAVFYMDIQQDWFDYKNSRYRDIAREWCKINGVKCDECD